MFIVITYTLINYSYICTTLYIKSDFEKEISTNKLKIKKLRKKIKNNLKVETSTNFTKEDGRSYLQLYKDQ